MASESLTLALPEEDPLAHMPGALAMPQNAVMHDCPPDPECRYCSGEIQGTPDELKWEFLDGVYCLSLKTRNDRAQRVAKEFHRVGLCQKVKFYRPDRHPVKGIIGSWESHRAVSQHALEHQLENALICEDDVLFAGKLTPKKLRSIGQTLGQLPSDWRIFYLGHWPVWAYFKGKHLLKTSSACAHAYVVSPRLMRWMDEHPWGSPGIEVFPLVGKALDSAFLMMQGTYAYFPMIAIQSISRSDNFNTTAKPRKKLKHFFSRSQYREWYLSKLMRPSQWVIAALSPLTWAKEKFDEWRGIEKRHN